ncbi:hypothetical protein [Arthrobacter sp. KK5.5]|uniref:hypothetical protein n=1 Tax=Arthrobacter sp. KK5.5 TaxID=3373084 RepID=UPI003EE43BA7
MRLRNASHEEGQTIILIIGYVVIALLAVSATLAATLVNTEARRLLSVADGAVAAAADSFSVSPATGRNSVGLELIDGAVRADVSGYLSDTGAAARFDGLGIVAAGATGDGTTAYVRLRATVRPPIVGWFVPAGIPIHVESNARTILTR